MLRSAFGAGPTAPLSVLCLGAHCDDVDIGCGATLLKLLGERPGSSVHWVTFASTPERERETRASAGDFLAGAAEARITVKAFRESYFPFIAPEIKDFFEELKRSTQPDVVFSHHRHDVHQDHKLLADLTWNTFRNHLILEYEIPKYEGDLGHPNLFVPVSRALAERKAELLCRHYATQKSRLWFRPETFLGLMSIRGVECQAEEGYAEAFHLRKIVI
ncbi:MAG TPA: PIG-L deacetylase family protein [Polyangiaceae bacterium]